jgi:multisubunit Na+/H+ antiporter MnhG subunit
MEFGSTRRPVVVMASVVAVVLAVTLAAPVVVRGPLVLWMACACPGVAWVGLLRLSDPLARWTLAVAASTALTTLATVAMVFTHIWSPTGLLVALIIVSVGGAVTETIAVRGTARSTADHVRASVAPIPVPRHRAEREETS